MTGAGRGLLDWGWAGAALEGESGDVHVVAEVAEGVLVGAIDGLGHGIEAAAAAREAARVLASHAGEPLPSLVERCHEALRRTRGAVMTLAWFEAGGSMTWAAVGNVDGILLRGGAAPEPRRAAIAPRGGIVGYHLPSLYPQRLPVSSGDVLVLATDGVHTEFAEDVPMHGAPREIAEGILARHARGSDDALVVVARYLAGSAGPARGGEGAGGDGGAA
jgi:negative regulator of sigma-B (phosphoserine phosphatase)